MPMLAEVLDSAWRRLSHKEGQEFGMQPVPPAVAVWGSSALRVTSMLRPQMPRSPMWCTCVCTRVDAECRCVCTCGIKQWKGHLCESPQAHTRLKKCHKKKMEEQVSWFLTGSTLNLFHLQMWTGALPLRRWPTNRHLHTACSSVELLTTWKPSGTNNGALTIKRFLQNVLLKQGMWCYFPPDFNPYCGGFSRSIYFLVAWLVLNEHRLLAHVQSFSVVPACSQAWSFYGLLILGLQFFFYQHP